MRNTWFVAKWLLVVMAAGGCAGLTGPTDQADENEWGTPADALPVWRGSLAFEGAYRFNENGFLQVAVTVHNVGDTPLVGQIFANLICVLEMRAYSSSDRQGAPLWQDDGNGFCRALGSPLAIQPGESQQLVAGRERGVVHRSTLPPGTTYFTARMIFWDERTERRTRTGEIPVGEVHVEP